MLITNIKGTLKSGRIQEGFYMQPYLVTNLLGIKDYLAKDWDVVGIFSGHGLVRVGKSTVCFQVASFVAWLMAGGKLDMELIEKDGKKVWQINKMENPKKELHWNLQENVVFTADDLRNRAHDLYTKYGKGQILVYDEGREGLDAKRAMENLNKIMEDFFQECGFMGHIIFIVLPNFFKLHEDYAVSRSIFLIDAFRNKKKQRGYFNFYDEKQKEWLYFLGKKRIGITFKYEAANESFWGKFTSWFPFDRVEYNKIKEEALKKRKKSRREVEWKRQRDAIIYYLKHRDGISAEELSGILQKECDVMLSSSAIEHSLEEFGGKVMKATE